MKVLVWYVFLLAFITTMGMLQCELTDTCLLVDYPKGSWSIIKSRD